MAEKKRYFWMKMKQDFFQSKEIKKLRKLAGGDTFTIIYLKMILKSIETDGKLFFDGVENTFAEEIALDINEDAENVKLTIAFLLAHDMIEQISESEILIHEAIENTGSECNSALRVRRMRERKALQCNDVVTKCNIELEKELEKETEKEIRESTESCCQSAAEEQQPSSKKKSKKSDFDSFGEYGGVKLTEEQYNKLVSDYGKSKIDEYIRKIDEWMKMYGKKPYKDFNLAIRNWLNRDGVEAIADGNGKRIDGII